MSTSRVSGVAALVLCGVACALGDSGIEPPKARVFLPAAAEIDSQGRFLFVVNSNSDLRFNAGTVVAVDLSKAALDRAASWQRCPSVRFLPSGPPARFCCWDLQDASVLNCDERAYVDPGTTVEIGSFGSSLVVQRFVRDGLPVDRLFLSVRGDPSVTFIEAHVQGADTPNAAVRLACHGSPGAPRAVPGTLCQAPFRIDSGLLTSGSPTPQKSNLPHEPYALALDGQLGLLYVGHLRGGVSVIDACAPEAGTAPVLVSTNSFVFRTPQESGVTTVVPVLPGDKAGSIFAMPRFGTEIGELVLSAPGEGRCIGRGSDARLVPVRAHPVAALFPQGSDLRGMVIDPVRGWAYVVHRNSNVNAPSASAVTRLRVTRDAGQGWRFESVQTVEIGSGPVAPVLHDAGRGPRLYVPCFEAGQIYVLDPERTEVTAIIDVGRGPAGIVFDVRDAGLAYVLGFADNNVSVVDLHPGSRTENRVVQRLGFPRTASQN